MPPTYAELFAAMKRFADPYDDIHRDRFAPSVKLAQHILFGRLIEAEEWWSGDEYLSIEELLKLHGIARDPP